MVHSLLKIGRRAKCNNYFLRVYKKIIINYFSGHSSFAASDNLGKMSLWAKVRELEGDSLRQIQNLYGPNFPIEFRHYFADIIERQSWYAALVFCFEVLFSNQMYRLQSTVFCVCVMFVDKHRFFQNVQMKSVNGMQ